MTALSRDDQLELFAERFLGAFDRHALDTSGVPVHELSLAEAYHIQSLVIDKRVARGERVCGYKVGCTSRAIRSQFRLLEPIWGRVLRPFVTHGDTAFEAGSFLQPAIEPEFVITMLDDVSRLPPEPGDLIKHIATVSAGIEIHNYHFWYEKPSIQELIASNGIHASLVTAERGVRPALVDWVEESVELLCNDELLVSGRAAEIMGGPLVSLYWLATQLLEQGAMLRKGDIVIPGSPVALIPVKEGDSITAQFDTLGSIRTTFR